MLSIEDSKKKWDFFQKHHWVAPEFTLSPIYQSWERCTKQCSPYNWSKPHIASGYTLASLVKRNARIIDCATTVVEDTYDLLPDEHLALLVSDDNGCLLFSIGHPEMLQQLTDLGIKTGCFLSEGQIGTNALSLCIHEHTPMQVFASEHFNRHLHELATVAAPIFDSHGKLRGTIAMVRRACDYRKESLVIITSCAKEIALQLHLHNEQESMNRLQSAHNATMECMDDGIIGWDDELRVTMVNPQAEKLFQLDARSVLDKEIFNTVRFAPNILDSIDAGDLVRRKQTTVEVNGAFIEAIITLYPLSGGSKLLFIHPIDKIRELAQQQIGGNAKYTFDTLPTVSRKVKHLITMAKRALKSQSPILITGEEGVGKIAMAMAIHNESTFKQGPFITLNCRSINTEQMIRETLGFDEGSGLPSKFELAHNGTLFLDKVEFLSPELQTVLLKLLKTGLVSRCDSQRLIPVKFQLITSSAANLQEYVDLRSFGRQLYYEISANELHIPPLRQRKDDIEHMILKIIASYEQRHNVAIAMEKVVMEVLTEYGWQGNNSELRNRMERILLNRRGNLIGLEDIPDEIKLNHTATQVGAEPSLLSLDEAEKRLILQAWQIYDGKMAEMAKALKIGRTTLWRKINKFDLADQLVQEN